jgi:hypothetical protein
VRHTVATRVVVVVAALLLAASGLFAVVTG